ncbi:NADPH-dependent FMN reductase [Streptomyces cinnamoneus]|uniref:NADPH-dependent FMN reductase n=1 Tax=Streptomyces cinnamoneus TaxID=53446 RepID=A0A2G1XMS4_STRCJ|nr:NAD(P)H-dependent oxidoreductase [Streptomyces cinnamoneus]PHQ52449.1 NADPH-dependent FMN reductase [Streptomyces cinnamoneus]PPT15981.1 NAD(P)H-dependent oxidoreductase [Streptomyces cinnamoneus]
MTTATPSTDTGVVRVLAISGSVRAGSVNSAILRAGAALAGAEVKLELWDGLKAVEPFSEDDEAAPGAGVKALLAAIAEADALLIATPEYNGSVPGQLKNALDWASRPYGRSVLVGKTASVIGASPSGFGAKWAQADLRKILGACGAEVVGEELCVAQAHTVLGEDGLPTDEELRTALTTLVATLVEAARAAKAA